jgi:formamidopyrimidine-DNA glycosylase
MPELPEVETVRRVLEPVMTLARFDQVIVRRPDLRVPFPLDFTRRLIGQTVVAVHRRAKYLVERDSADAPRDVRFLSGRYPGAQRLCIYRPDD